MEGTFKKLEWSLRGIWGEWECLGWTFGIFKVNISLGGSLCGKMHLEYIFMSLEDWVQLLGVFVGGPCGCLWVGKALCIWDCLK